MRPSLRHLCVSIGSALLLAACGGGGGGSPPPDIQPLGTLRVALTDAPACGYDHVWVTVDRVRVHRSDGADPGDDGDWHEIPLATPQRIDLLTLVNGTLLPLGQTELPAGRYRQMRLVLVPNTTAEPLANAIQPTGGVPVPLTTPSAQQSGLKMNVDLAVPPGEVLDVAIDFDACKSFVKAGNSGKVLLKPVLRVIPLLNPAGQRIVGFLDGALVAAGANVSVQLEGLPDPVRATPPDENGMFVLYPVPAGSYDLVVTAPGRVNAVVTGVPVTNTTSTLIGSASVRIDPPLAAASYAVSGTTDGTDVGVRALQTLASTGAPVEVAWTAADADTGAFGFVLPAAAPWSVAYTPAFAAIVFAEDGVAAYRIEAQDAGGTVLFEDLDPFTGPVTDLEFPFP